MFTKYLAYIYALAAVLLWSTVATAFKLALAFFSPLQLVFIAVVTSIICLLTILCCQKKLPLIYQQFKHKPLFYLTTALLNPFLYYLVLFKAYEQLPAQQALSLNYTWAILLPLMAAPLLKQKLLANDLLAAVIGYIGVVIIATNGQLTSIDFTNVLGIIMALLSTLFWCLYWIINTKDNGDPIVSLMLSFMLSIPFIAGALVIDHMIAGSTILPQLSWQALAAGIYVGLFEMGLTFVLWLLALKSANESKDINTAKISTLAFLTPLLSMVFITLILKETITNSTYIGMGLILTAILFQQVLLTYKNKTQAVD